MDHSCFSFQPLPSKAITTRDQSGSGRLLGPSIQACPLGILLHGRHTLYPQLTSSVSPLLQVILLPQHLLTPFSSCPSIIKTFTSLPTPGTVGTSGRTPTLSGCNSLSSPHICHFQRKSPNQADWFHLSPLAQVSGMFNTQTHSLAVDFPSLEAVSCSFPSQAPLPGMPSPHILRVKN